MADNIRKVTFYDNVNFDTQEINNVIVPVLSDSHDNAIYFTPTTGTGANQPKHIAHGGQFYTLGSKLSYLADDNDFVPIKYKNNNGAIQLEKVENDNDIAFMFSGVSDEYQKTLTLNTKFMNFENLITAFNALSNKLEALQASFNKHMSQFMTLIEFTGIYGIRYNNNISPNYLGKSENSIDLLNGESFILNYSTNPSSANPSHLYEANVYLEKLSNNKYTEVGYWYSNTDPTSEEKLLWYGNTNPDFTISTYTSSVDEDYSKFNKTTNNINNYKFTIKYTNTGETDAKSKTLNVNYKALPIKVFTEYISNSGATVKYSYLFAKNEITVNSETSLLYNVLNTYNITGKDLTYDENYWKINNYTSYGTNKEITSTSSEYIYNDTKAILSAANVNSAYYPVKANLSLHAYGFRYRTSYIDSNGNISYTCALGNEPSFKVSVDSITSDGVNIFSKYCVDMLPTIPGNHFNTTSVGSLYNMYVMNSTGTEVKLHINADNSAANLTKSEISETIVGSYVNIYAKQEANTGIISVNKSAYFSSADNNIKLTYGSSANINYALKTTTSDYTYTPNVTIDNLTFNTHFTYTNGVISIKREGVNELLKSSTNITVNANLTCNVKQNSVKVTGITLTPASSTVEIGKTTTITATINPSNATIKTLNWKSSNEDIATVDSTGKVTIKALGTVEISATSTDGTNIIGKTSITGSKISVTITAPTVKTGLVYNGSAKTLINAGSVSDTNAGTFKYNTLTTLPTGTNADTYSIQWLFELNNNYQTTSETSGVMSVTINKANGKLTLSKSSVTIENGKTDTITISENTGALSVSSNDTSKATASITGNTVTITGTGEGNTTVKVTTAASTDNNYKELSKTVNVTVNPKPVQYYYYAGWTCPTNEEELANLAVEPNGGYIGTTLGTYNASNMLYSFIDNPIGPNTSKDQFYIVIPKGIKIYDALQLDTTDAFTLEGTIGEHNVYKSVSPFRNIDNLYIF